MKMRNINSNLTIAAESDGYGMSNEVRREGLIDG